MIVTVFHRLFDKQYAKLPPAQKRRFEEAITLFKTDPYNPLLYNHALKGKWEGHRSISFGGDWRAHYVSISKNKVFFVAVGRHNKLYRG